MISFANIRTVIANALKAYTGAEVVMANQTATMPDYPYISFTVSTAMSANNGTFGRYIDPDDEDGAIYGKQVNQIWSFTVQSDDADEAAVLAYKAHDYFDLIGREYLYDNGMAVVRVESITNRDSLLSVMYEYRYGFDVTLAMMNVVSSSELGEGVIETADFNN